MLIAVSREEFQNDMALGRGSAKDGGDRHNLAEDQLEKRTFTVFLGVSTVDGIRRLAVGDVQWEIEQPLGGGWAWDPFAVKGAGGGQEGFDHMNSIAASVLPSASLCYAGQYDVLTPVSPHCAIM
ncbi:MAG: hypothetical protein U0X20_00620 [Caldilineaceae bacterium]